MNDHLHFPEQVIEVGGKSYKLNGTFRTLARIEQAMDMDIKYVHDGLLDMRPSDFVRVLATAITASGKAVEEDDLGQAIQDTMGFLGADYAILRLTVRLWLRVALTDPEAREKKADELGAILGEAKSASLGGTTSASA